MTVATGSPSHRRMVLSVCRLYLKAALLSAAGWLFYTFTAFVFAGMALVKDEGGPLSIGLGIAAAGCLVTAIFHLVQGVISAITFARKPQKIIRRVYIALRETGDCQ